MAASWPCWPGAPLLAVPAAAWASGAPYVVVYKSSVQQPGAATAGFHSQHGINPQFTYSSALKGFAANPDRRPAQVRAAEPRRGLRPARRHLHRDRDGPARSGRNAAGRDPPGRRSDVNPGALEQQGRCRRARHRDRSRQRPTSTPSARSTASRAPPRALRMTTVTARTSLGRSPPRIRAAESSGSRRRRRLYAVKVLDKTGTGTLSQILCGIQPGWPATAAALNIKVANMSLAGSGTNDNNCGKTNKDAEHQAICAATAAGITFVASAGNCWQELCQLHTGRGSGGIDGHGDDRHRRSAGRSRRRRRGVTRTPEDDSTRRTRTSPPRRR